MVNPASGAADDATLPDIERRLGPLGDLGTLQPSSADRLPDEVRAAAASAGVVAVAGGDGTFNQVVNALADRLDGVVFALLPTGTGNDLARTLGLPEDPVEAAQVAARGSERRIDVGRATGPGTDRLFVNACIGGFPVLMNEAVDPELKRRVGPLAFWVGGARVAVDLPRTTVTMNGRRVPDCVAAGVGNGVTSGGGIPVWPRADAGDGMLDGCALGARGPVEAARLAAKVRVGTHPELDDVLTLRGRRIEIDSDPPIGINVDGELVGLETPAAFEVAGGLRIKAPGT